MSHLPTTIKKYTHQLKVMMLKYSYNIIFSSQKAAVFKNVLLIVHIRMRPFYLSSQEGGAEKLFPAFRP